MGAGCLFVRRQARIGVPMLGPALFSNAAFSGAILVNLLSVIALVGGLFFVSQHLQLVLGFSPLDAGFVLVPGLIGTIVAGLVIVPIARRFRPSLLTPIGLLISSAGYAGIVLSGGQISAAGIALTFSAIALGIGAGFVLLAAVVGASMLRNAR